MATGPISQRVVDRPPFGPMERLDHDRLVAEQQVTLDTPRRRPGLSAKALFLIMDVVYGEARTLETKLSFLPSGRKYRAEIYRDADDADWQTNPTAYTIESREVDSESTLPIRLARGGGQAIRLTPAEPARTAKAAP
jgi:hypothetical protein